MDTDDDLWLHIFDTCFAYIDVIVTFIMVFQKGFYFFYKPKHCSVVYPKKMWNKEGYLEMLTTCNNSFTAYFRCYQTLLIVSPLK